MPRLALPLALPLLLATACSLDGAGDKGDARWVPGKGDGVFDTRERGPLPVDGARSVVLDGAVLAFRVESYGGTALSIDLRGRGGADPYVVVEGVDQNDDSRGTLDSHLDVILPEPGVYRVLVGSYESLALGLAPAGDAIEIDARCTAACARPAMSQAQLLAQLRDSGQLDVLLARAEVALGDVVPEPAMRDALVAQLRGIAASPDFDGIDRFPTVPLQGFGQLRPALGLLDAEPPAEDTVVQGELAELLGPCNATRTPPAPLAQLPGLGYGHFPNLALTDCQVAHAGPLAQVLTSLAAGNGSVVTYRGTQVRTPGELFAALAADGHTIETRNERTYANFISLTAGDVDVRWPVWIDTGVVLPDGNPLVIPTGHSHHAWRIEGPVVNTRVMFYLGISGAAFFGQVNTRPGWTGDRASDVRTDAASAVDTADVSAAYLRRIRVERETLAAGMPADGYGFLGVCNDSNAVVELATRGTITTFPLVRAAALDDAPSLGDGLDAALRQLPHDADAAGDRDDAIRRILAMTPHDLDDAAAWWDAALRADLLAARASAR